MWHKGVLTEKINNTEQAQLHVINRQKLKKKNGWSLSHHGHLERIDVKGSDLPVAANVVNELDETVKPEHPGNNQHEHHKCIVTDAARENILLIKLRM